MFFSLVVVIRTGHALLHTLYGYSTKFKNIELFSEFFVLDILRQDGAVVGALALDMDDSSLHRYGLHIFIKIIINIMFLKDERISTSC